MLSWVEHGKSFKTLGPDLLELLLVLTGQNVLLSDPF